MLLAALVGLVAVAAVTPLATGAPPKFYSLTASPTAVCLTGDPQTQQFALTITNRSRNTAVGSANITAPSFISLVANTLGGDVTTGSSVEENTVKLRNLALSTEGSSRTVTISATIAQVDNSGVWTSVAKQSNDFADAPGSGNLVTLQGDPPPLSVATCTLEFTGEIPSPWQKGTKLSAPTAVGIWNGVGFVDSSGTPPVLSASGAGTIASFDGASNPVYSTTAKTWSWPDLSPKLSATSGAYTLGASMGSLSTTSNEFEVVDCVPDTSGNCNSSGVILNPNGDTGASILGSGIASPIVLSFDPSPLSGGGEKICSEGWGWKQLKYTLPDGTEGVFAAVGAEWEYQTNPTGDRYLKLTTYLRNDLYVKTNPSNTNDIQVCAGARHAHTANATTQDSTERAFTGRASIKAKWDTETGLYWGVLERIPNCNRARDLDRDGILDPALCGWGTQDVGGVLYRTATVLIPYDWDWKGVT
jgi:hypothetical protein